MFCSIVKRSGSYTLLPMDVKKWYICVDAIICNIISGSTAGRHGHIRLDQLSSWVCFVNVNYIQNIKVNPLCLVLSFAGLNQIYSCRAQLQTIVTPEQQKHQV